VAYDLGDLVPLRVLVKDSAGAAANATSVSVTITAPNGTTSTSTVSPTTTGQYDYTYTPTTAGRYLVRWVATGTNASSYTDAFTVNDPADLSLLSLTDAKAYLNVTSTSSDEELRQFILEASDIAERLTGRQLRRRTVVASFSNDGTEAVVLDVLPAASITSVTENGVTLTAGTDYVADLVAGVIRRGTTLTPLVWATGRGHITVTYVAGEANPSPTAQLLVKELTRHLWRTQRGASPMGMGGQDDFIPGGNNIVTYRVKELADMIAMPGIA